MAGLDRHDRRRVLHRCSRSRGGRFLGRLCSRNHGGLVPATSTATRPVATTAATAVATFGTPACAGLRRTTASGTTSWTTTSARAARLGTKRAAFRARTGTGARTAAIETTLSARTFGTRTSGPHRWPVAHRRTWTAVGIAWTARWESALAPPATCPALALTTTVVWRTGQGPTSTPTRHLATAFAAITIPARPIVAELSATAALGTSAKASGAARTTAPRTATTIAAAWSATTIAIPAVERVALALRPRHQVDHVEELAALLRTLRSVLALEHAHQADLPNPPAGHVQGLHQARKAVALHLQSSTDSLGFGALAQRWFWRGLGRRSVGRCLASSLDTRRRSVGRGLGVRRCSVGRGVGVCRTIGGARFRGCPLGVRSRGRRWLRARRFGLRMLCPECPLNLRRPLQHNSRKLCDGLHCVRPSWPISQGSSLSDRALVVDVLDVLVNGNVSRHCYKRAKRFDGGQPLAAQTSTKRG